VGLGWMYHHEDGIFLESLILRELGTCWDFSAWFSLLLLCLFGRSDHGDMLWIKLKMHALPPPATK